MDHVRHLEWRNEVYTVSVRLTVDSKHRGRNAKTTTGA
jgi:hypothetical protein